MINFLAFATLQMVAFVTARAVWVSRIYGYMVLGLILCLSTAWIPQGGLFDFRADLMAYCLYGIWACAILRSKLFLDRRWAIGCSLIGAFLVANRFLTIVYLLGVSVGFAGVCVFVGLLWRTDGDLADRMWRRFFNICLSLCVLAVITAPRLIVNWTAIHAYYIIGHIANVTGTPLAGEKYVRALAAGITDLTGHLLFYPRCILLDHLGSTFLLGSVLAITTGLIARLLGRSQTPGVRRESRKDETFLLQIIFLVGAILGPILVLTADISKSGTTGGIVGVPAALLVVTLTAAIAPKLREFESAHLCNFCATCSLLIFVLGLSSEFEHFSRHLPEYAQRRDLERLAELDKWLIDHASEHGWQNSTMFVDVISPWFHTEAITAAGYEQTRRFVEFRPMIGVGGLEGIMGVDKPEALRLLAMSDFVILTSLPKTGVYPFYERVARYWGDLKAWADENMIVARTVPFDSFTATVYIRPTAIVSGISSDGWVTSHGLLIEAPRTLLQRFPKIRLSGSADCLNLIKIPAVSARVDSTGGSQAAPASLRRIDDSYEILIDTSSVELLQSDPVRFHLDFDSFFVPKKLGINVDNRELVVRKPLVVQLIR